MRHASSVRLINNYRKIQNANEQHKMFSCEFVMPDDAADRSGPLSVSHTI